MAANKPLSVLSAMSFGIFIAGLLIWLWSGEWRWALTLTGVSLVILIIEATRHGKT